MAQECTELNTDWTSDRELWPAWLFSALVFVHSTVISFSQVCQRAQECSNALTILEKLQAGNGPKNLLGDSFDLNCFKVITNIAKSDKVKREREREKKRENFI